MENSITINGIKHVLVEDGESTSCKNCSLYEHCLAAFCIDLFNDSKSHFEISKD